MNFLKKISEKIRLIFIPEKKEKQISEIQEIKQAKKKDKINAKDERNTKLEKKINNLLSDFSLNRRLNLSDTVLTKLYTAELNSLVFSIDSYSLILSENEEYFLVNISNSTDKIIFNLNIDLNKEKYFLLYEREYYSTKNKNIEITFNEDNKILDYKFSLVEYIKIKISEFLCLNYPEILEYKKYYIDEESEFIVSNIGEYMKRILFQENKEFDYEELKKYFEKEMDKNAVKKISYDENGNFYFEYSEERFIKETYLLYRNQSGSQKKYFRVDFKNFISLQNLINLELEELNNIEVYKSSNEKNKLIFYNKNKKTYIQTIYEIQKDEIILI